MKTAEFCAAAGWLEHVDGTAGGAGFARHVDRIGGDHQRIGVRQEIRIRVVAGHVPQDAWLACGRYVDRADQPLVRSPGRRDHETRAEGRERAECGLQPVVVGIGEAVDAVPAAEHNRHARLRQPGDRLGHAGAQAAETRGGEAVRRGRRRDDVGATAAIMRRHPDQVGRVRTGLGILQHDRESTWTSKAAQAADIGDAGAAGGDRNGGPRRGELAAGLAESVARRDGSPGRRRLPYPARRDVLHLVVEAERVGDAARLHVHAGLAVGDDPARQARHWPSRRCTGRRRVAFHAPV